MDFYQKSFSMEVNTDGHSLVFCGHATVGSVLFRVVLSLTRAAQMFSILNFFQVKHSTQYRMASSLSLFTSMQSA